MKIAEIVTALGGGALVGWVSKAFIAREARLTREADVERERVKTTGETDVAALRADQDTAKLALNMAAKELDRYERSVMGHMECLAKVENLQTRLDLLEADRAGCPARIARLEQQIHVMSAIMVEKGLLPALKEPAE